MSKKVNKVIREEVVMLVESMSRNLRKFFYKALEYINIYTE